MSAKLIVGLLALGLAAPAGLSYTVAALAPDPPPARIVEIQGEFRSFSQTAASLTVRIPPATEPRRLVLETMDEAPSALRSVSLRPRQSLVTIRLDGSWADARALRLRIEPAIEPADVSPAA
jgi:hypothetical protein